MKENNIEKLQERLETLHVTQDARLACNADDLDIREEIAEVEEEIKELQDDTNADRENNIKNERSSIEEDIERLKLCSTNQCNICGRYEKEECMLERNRCEQHILSDYKRVLKENEILKEEKEQAWEEWNNLEQGSYETELKLKEENRELKAEMKDGVIAIKLYALQTENEKLKKKIDLMENYLVENGWEICFDNIYAELNNCNGMERDWCRGDKLEKQDIHKYFSKKLLESEE